MAMARTIHRTPQRSSCPSRRRPSSRSWLTRTRAASGRVTNDSTQVANRKRPNRRRRVKKATKAARTRAHLRNRARNLKLRLSTYGRPITRRQFDAFCYVRMPLIRFIATEIEWYSLFDGNLIATIVRDETDQDFGFVILGRDERRLFRAIDLDVSYPTPRSARAALANCLREKYAGQLKEVYPQRDAERARLDLFAEVVPPASQHRNYTVLATEPRFEAARNLIGEI